MPSSVIILCKLTDVTHEETTVQKTTKPAHVK